MSDSAHIAAIKKHDRLNRLSAARRFRIAGGRVEKYQAELPAHDIEEVVAKAAVAEQLANPQIGDLIPGKGIYFGKYTFTGETGNLKKVFNMFAAPEDVADAAGSHFLSYNQAIEAIAALDNWHGQNGTPYASHTEIYKALEEDTYRGGWFMPPREIVSGTDGGWKKVQPDNLLEHKDKGAFAKQTSDEYWVSTTDGSFFRVVAKGRVSLYSSQDHKSRCRPVRLEPVP